MPTVRLNISLGRAHEVGSQMLMLPFYPTKKQIRNILRSTGSFDTVSQDKQGVWTVKRQFFYRLGNSPEKLAGKVLKVLPSARIVEMHEEWKQWPGRSNFIVRFTQQVSR